MKRAYGYDGERFAAYWWFVSWTAFSLGLHVSLRPANIEIHLPFGFFRLGESSRATLQKDTDNAT